MNVLVFTEQTCYFPAESTLRDPELYVGGSCMHLIWKRPDGFHNSLPEDFRRVTLSNGASLWLHRSECDWYPFQVNGDWASQEQTVRINRIVNLLDAKDDQWKTFVDQDCGDDLSPNATPEKHANGLVEWLESLKACLKGTTWEVDIMTCALSDAQKRLKDART